MNGGESQTEEWEIKTLKKAGILEWPESEDDASPSEKSGVNELKRNRIRFLESLSGSNRAHADASPQQNTLNFDLSGVEEESKFVKKALSNQ